MSRKQAKRARFYHWQRRFRALAELQRASAEVYSRMYPSDIFSIPGRWTGLERLAPFEGERLIIREDLTSQQLETLGAEYAINFDTQNPATPAAAESGHTTKEDDHGNETETPAVREEGRSAGSTEDAAESHQHGQAGTQGPVQARDARPEDGQEGLLTAQQRTEPEGETQ